MKEDNKCGKDDQEWCEVISQHLAERFSLLNGELSRLAALQQRPAD
jgi:hypothetical protein